MSTKRIFTQAVCMHCTQKQFDTDLLEKLEEFGYDVSGLNFDEYNMILCEKTDVYTTDSEQGYYVKGYNPEFFLALAAMSAGEEYYKGEPLRFTNSMTENFGYHERIVFFDSIINNASAVNGNVKFSDPEHGDCFNTRPQHIRKATFEEVLHYYKWVDKEMDKVIEVVKDSLKTGAALGSPDKTNEPDFVTEYKEQSFFEENITKELQEESAAYTADEWFHKLGISPDTIENMAGKIVAVAKLSKILAEWIPEPFEPIWVWSNGETKRHRMLFAFFSEDGVFAFEEQFEKWSRFEVHEYKNFAKIDAPVVISQTIAKATFALEYGVPDSLIQIGQTDEP